MTETVPHPEGRTICMQTSLQRQASFSNQGAHQSYWPTWQIFTDPEKCIFKKGNQNMTPCIDYLLLLFLPRIYSKPFASHSSTASVLLFLQPTALRKHFHKCSSWTFLKTEELNRDGDTITEQWGAINYFVTINVATPKPDCKSRKKTSFFLMSKGSNFIPEFCFK